MFSSDDYYLEKEIILRNTCHTRLVKETSFSKKMPNKNNICNDKELLKLFCSSSSNDYYT